MDGRRGRAGGAGEAAGLAGGQRLHEEATRVCPCQLGRRLQGVRAQRGRLAAGRQRDVLRQLILALLLFLLLFVWGTQRRPDSARGGRAPRAPPAPPPSPPPCLQLLGSAPRQRHAPPRLPLSGSRGFSEVVRLANCKEARQGVRVPPRGPPPAPSAPRRAHLAHDRDWGLALGLGHSMLDQVVHVLVVEQPDEVERAKAGSASQGQVPDHHGAAGGGKEAIRPGATPRASKPSYPGRAPPWLPKCVHQ